MVQPSPSQLKSTLRLDLQGLFIIQDFYTIIPQLRLGHLTAFNNSTNYQDAFSEFTSCFYEYISSPFCSSLSLLAIILLVLCFQVSFSKILNHGSTITFLEGVPEWTFYILYAWEPCENFRMLGVWTRILGAPVSRGPVRSESWLNSCFSHKMNICLQHKSKKVTKYCGHLL